MVGNYGRFTDQHSVEPQERDNQRDDALGERLAGGSVPVAGVEMGKRYTVRELGAELGQSLAHVAEQEEPGRGNAIRMSGNRALADIDFAIWEQVSEMVVCSAVSQSELEQVTIQTCNQLGGHFETSALRFEPADEAVQPAHQRHAATPVVLRSRSISAEAARS